MSQSIGEPLIYALYAVLVHSGFNCNAGHYLCFIKVDISLISNRVKSVLTKKLLLVTTVFRGKGCIIGFVRFVLVCFVL